MRRLTSRAMTMIMALLTAACVSDAPTEGLAPQLEAELTISDGGNGGLVPGFIWLTPTVKNGPKSFTGTFDPALDPVIDICPIASDALPGSSACSGAVIRTLSATSQPEIIRVDLLAENYSVTWQSTNAGDIVVGGKYRAVLRVGTRVLGWVDLQAVAKQRDVASVRAGFAAVVRGSPFVFKWRIETGIPGAVVITPTPVTIKDNATQLFTAVVTDLHGQLLPAVTVNWTIDNTAIATMAPASGPTDNVGETTSTATPAIGVGGTTTVRANSQGAVGTASLTVTLAVGSVTVTPVNPTINDAGTQVFTATVRDLLNNPLPGAAVTWSIDNASVATLSPGSGTSNASGQTTTTATPAGTLATTIVRATADGVEGSTTLTVVSSCSLTGPDADGDRLPDCYETNTRVFLGTTDTGTDPNNADTDGDNIRDGDEVLGTTAGLDLRAMGANPLRQDILLEYDWFDDNLDGCGAHSHRPGAATITRLTASFNAAPILNPDGSTGINVINDYGQGGAFTGGNLIADADGVIAGGVGGADYTAHKTANFAANRNGYFHYVLMPHRYATSSGSSGQAEINGDDLIVSIYCFGRTEDVNNVSNTIMHELGHNLGLRHGGNEDSNGKPNYNSIMNYRFQFPGIDSDCTNNVQGGGDQVLSFSVGTRPVLNENNLDERQGVCGNPPGPGWDWNLDGDATDFGFAQNITRSIDSGNSALEILNDFNDWANLNLAGIGDATGSPFRSFSVPEVATCTNAPTSAR